MSLRLSYRFVSDCNVVKKKKQNFDLHSFVYFRYFYLIVHAFSRFLRFKCFYENIICSRKNRADIFNRKINWHDNIHFQKNTLEIDCNCEQ